MKNILLISLVLLNIFCSAQDTVTAPTVLKGETIQHDRWVYAEDTNKMTSEKNYYAFYSPSTKIYLPAPNGGGSYPAIQLFYGDGVNYVYIYISKGQFIESSSSFKVRMRFDEEQSEYYTFHSSSDGRKDLIAANLSTANKIIAKLKKAKRLRVEVNFYKDNGEVLEFNIADLKWDHKGKETPTK